MIVTTFIVVIITSLLLFRLFRDKKCLPGPWNLPIVGCIHKLDPAAPHLTLTKLVQKYGPVYRVKLGSINVTVIADAKLLTKVLSKDEALRRPPLYVMNNVFNNKGIRFETTYFGKFTVVVGSLCCQLTNGMFNVSF